jgi:hypothetical protein
MIYYVLTITDMEEDWVDEDEDGAGGFDGWMMMIDG